ncbi:hypothetical protein ARMGADRAFT_1092850 [Armillaria gallica]|uniref:HNH nuclease domain-containing protein n=1 Tax=Armillaria gallica TaxID=47427 RepID=A0A2H3CWP2_ARMGA|nr:hypothetical protein ARMGADRAFT_1092850 [Armillaria gallica]
MHYASCPALPPSTTLSDGLSDAYNICLEFEKSAPPDSAALVYVRTLVYLIIHSPSRTAFVNAIHSCAWDYAKLSQLGHAFIEYFIRPYPDPPSHDEPKRDLRVAPKTHKEAKDLPLVRDGFRCVVSGNYDQDTLSKVSASIDEIEEAGIVNEELASVLAILKCFGHVNGTNVHCLSNIMTMQLDVHEASRLCTPPYPAQSHPHTHPGPLRNAIHLSLPPEMTFTAPDNENLPVPSETARYLCQSHPVLWRGREHR